MKWYGKNQEKLNLEELKKFSEEVLEMENPDLNKYFVMFVPANDKLLFTFKKS